MVKRMKQVRLTNEEISGLCLSLSMLLHAGVGAGDGLFLLAEDEERPVEKEVLTELAAMADRGMTLSETFRESGVFPSYVPGLVYAGEMTGRLEESLAALAAYYEDRMRMERQIRQALLYPSMLLLVMLAVIVVLLVKVLPVFDAVYGQLGSSLTGIAGGLLSLGVFLERMMPLLLGLLILASAGLLLFSASSSVRSKILLFWRCHFGGRGISEKMNTARIAQVLSMGLGSGLPIESAMELAASLMEDIPSAKERCQACAAALSQGAPLHRALRQHGVLPQAECRLLEVGMKGGLGDSAMEGISRRLMEESEEALQKKVGQVEPALVMFTSVLVGLILLSVMLPLVHIMSAIG